MAAVGASGLSKFISSTAPWIFLAERGDAIEQAVFWRAVDLFQLDVDLVFYDGTTAPAPPLGAAPASETDPP